MEKTVIECPSCGGKMKIHLNSGKTYTCPHCAYKFKQKEKASKKKTTKQESAEESKKSNWFSGFIGILGTVIIIKLVISFLSNALDFDSYVAGNDRNVKALSQAVDVENNITNDYAVRLASMYPGEYNIGQVCRIYDHLVQNWKYVNDSDKEEIFRSASRTIKNNLAGDCDDFAILMAAMIESVGGDARISFAQGPDGGHAFTEILASSSKEGFEGVASSLRSRYWGTNSIHYTVDKEGNYWLNMDWFGRPQHPGGEYFQYSKRAIYYPTQPNKDVEYQKR